MDSMTKMDIINKLRSEFPEEVEDSKNYFMMAQAAENMGHYDVAEGLYEIAKDEYTHARFIKHFLKNTGEPIPEAECEKYHEIKKMIAGKFC